MSAELMNGMIAAKQRPVAAAIIAYSMAVTPDLSARNFVKYFIRNSTGNLLKRDSGAHTVRQHSMHSEAKD